MNEEFDKICEIFKPYKFQQFYSNLPETKSSLQLVTEKASGTTPMKFFLELRCAEIAILRCEMREAAYKTLLSKHVGFATLYEKDANKGSQLFFLFANAYNMDSLVQQPTSSPQPQQQQQYQQPQRTQSYQQPPQQFQPSPQHFQPSPQQFQQPRPQSSPQPTFGGPSTGPRVGHKCIYTSSGTPYHATVKAVNGRMIILGFDGYDANWDQTVDYEYNAISDAQWNEVVTPTGPCVGHKCVYTSSGTNYNATVKAVNGRVIILGFDGYDTNWDQTVDMDYQGILNAQWRGC